MKAKWAIDIDSILYDFDKLARDEFLRLSFSTNNYEESRMLRRGSYVAWPEWRSPADVCGAGVWAEVVALCHRPEVILAQRPFDGAVETLQQLVEADYDLMYISHRTGEAADATREWLENSGFPMDSHVEVICTDEEKKHHIGECQYIIDDRPKTMIEFVYDPNWSGGVKIFHEPAERIDSGERWALSLTYPYNQALTDIPNIFLAPTWLGLNEWLERKRFIRKAVLV